MPFAMAQLLTIWIHVADRYMRPIADRYKNGAEKRFITSISSTLKVTGNQLFLPYFAYLYRTLFVFFYSFCAPIVCSGLDSLCQFFFDGQFFQGFRNFFQDRNNFFFIFFLVIESHAPLLFPFFSIVVVWLVGTSQHFLS